MKMITVSFFQAFSPEGRALFKEVQRELEGKTLRGYPVKLIEEKEYRMMPAIRACLESDLVIFDGSIEDEENRQYYAAIELMKCLDHVLIVSRTMLPFNFEGMRKGGAPQFIQTNTIKYSRKKTNREILDWLLDVLQNSNLELPRAIKPNLPESEYQKNVDLIQRIEKRLMLDSGSRITDRSDAFVSYLSKYSKRYERKPGDPPRVEELFEIIAQTCRNPSPPKKRFRAAPQSQQATDADILYFPPGEISLEFMTAQRRFEIVSVTESYILRCSTFWIYRTEDYDSSWWAYGELLSLARVFREDMSRCPDIYEAKPVKNARGEWEFEIRAYITPEEKASVLPELTEYQMRELSRIQVNSDPNTVGYEQVEKMREQARLPDLLLRVEHRAMVHYFKKVLSVMVSDEKDEQEKALREARDFGLFKESVHSYVYTKAFWEDHIVECPVCKAAVHARLSPEVFMHFHADYFHAVPAEEYQAAMGTPQEGPQKVPLRCGHTVSMKQSGVYYRWWTVKSDVPTGPNRKLIERVRFTEFLNGAESG